MNFLIIFAACLMAVAISKFVDKIVDFYFKKNK